MNDFWFIHHRTHRFEFRMEPYNREKVKDPDLPLKMLLHLYNEVYLPLKEGRFSFKGTCKVNRFDTQEYEINQIVGDAQQAIIDTLWFQCSPEQKQVLISELPEKLFQKAKSDYQAQTVEEKKRLVTTHCVADPCNAKRIVFIKIADYSDDESFKGLSLYIKKHRNECYIVNDNHQLISVLQQLEMQQSQDITLTVINDNNRKDERFLDWTLWNAGEKIGEIVGQFNCIGHVRIISCEAGEPDPVYFKHHTPVHEKRGSAKDLTSRMLFFYNKEEKAIPYKESSLAAKIWTTALAKNPQKEFSISASPTYLHLDSMVNPQHFIGSDEGNPYNPHSFKKVEPFTRLKSITLTTEKGMKSQKFKSSQKESSLSSTGSIIQTTRKAEVRFDSPLIQAQLIPQESCTPDEMYVADSSVDEGVSPPVSPNSSIRATFPEVNPLDDEANDTKLTP